MSKKLFSEFEAVSESAWKQKIQVDLKGADYNETLLSKTASGLHIKPIYHKDSAPEIQIPCRATEHWYISQRIVVTDANKANQTAHDVLNRGAEGVQFELNNSSIDVKSLFNGLPEYGIQVHLNFMDVDFIKSIHKEKPKAYIHLDPIYHLCTTGNWFNNLKADLSGHQVLLSDIAGYSFNITVNTSSYQHAGAHVVQELGYYAAHLNEYLNTLNESDSLEYFFNQDPVKRINVDLAVGANYFEEIAKIQAYRVITKSLGEVYGIENLSCYITTTPSIRNKSIKDYNVNMLRTTTECMSAILGGADTVTNISYDSFFNNENEFGSRISRNQLRILKDEAYFDKVQNPTKGAYFIDSLTEEITHKALDLFKSIESSGGLLNQLFEGTIQRKIKESHQKEMDQVHKGERILVGVNKYENLEEQLPKQFDKNPFGQRQVRKTLIQPIIAKRISMDHEKKVIK